MIVFLVAPFLFFSNLEIFSDPNLVTGAKITFDLYIVDTSTNENFHSQIFVANNPLSIKLLTEEQFKNYTYDDFAETKFFDYDQVQHVTLKNASEEIWTISRDYKQQLGTLINRAATGDSNIKVSLELNYAFIRPVIIVLFNLYLGT